MPKRRRLLTTPMKNKMRANNTNTEIDESDREVTTARGRLKGALMDVLEPTGDDSDISFEPSPTKRDRSSQDYSKREIISDDEDDIQRQQLPPRQPYVLKLFDRSVDLSQFKEDSPLYPVCRAWIANQPKADYSTFYKKEENSELTEDSIEIPGAEGPPVSKIPHLLPEQKACNKDNINLNYREAPPPSREQLLQSHMSRWTAVRRAWLDQAALVEARYAAAQRVLNSINVNAL